jgi:polar amino acid transport system substrate-binding protein
MTQKLTVARSEGADQAFKDLLVGLYPGLADAAKTGVKGQVEPLKTQLLKADMFIAFSKKSPCLGQIKAFGRKLSAMRANGSIETIVRDATKTWDSAQR